ncbi:MAG TPA: GntR family transcriptional regulator [Jatrophihabitantaceae bacterium]|jgi:DNA-binding GntR family transcriptional regulator|nr:GntR family transcriptional regulator [Jatrophihabitantaceae bacterium]
MSEPSYLTRLSVVDEIDTLRNRIHQQLVALIVAGDLPPGTRLVENELARRLGVSRAPVREALQLLERDGWVDTNPRRATVVHRPSRHEIEDFFEVRFALEVQAARLAARRATPPEMAAKLRAQVSLGRELLDYSLVEAAGSTDLPRRGPRGLVEANNILHSMIAEVSGNDLLLKMQTSMTLQADWYLTPLRMGRRHDAWDEHEAIVEAIRDGDEHAATRVMGEHIDRTREAALLALE